MPDVYKTGSISRSKCLEVFLIVKKIGSQKCALCFTTEHRYSTFVNGIDRIVNLSACDTVGTVCEFRQDVAFLQNLTDTGKLSANGFVPLLI